VAQIRTALERAIASGLGDPLFIDGLADPDVERYHGLIARVRNAPPLFR
jgi:hypothetical protein